MREDAVSGRKWMILNERLLSSVIVY